MSSKQCVIINHLYLLIFFFFLQQQCSTTLSFQFQQKYKYKYSDGRRTMMGRRISSSSSGEGLVTVVHLPSSFVVTTTTATEQQHNTLVLFSIPIKYNDDIDRSDNNLPRRRRDVLVAGGGTFSLAAIVVGTLLFPSNARAGTGSSNEEYKDVTTKISSKLLTSSETVTESDDDALSSINWSIPKVTGLTTEEMAQKIEKGLRRDCWFVTGRSMPELFADSFTFSDPQVSLTGIEDYSRGVRKFYKQDGSAIGEVVCTGVTAPNTITVIWRNYGTVNIGPGFELAPYLVTTTLTTSPNNNKNDGLIVKQEDAFETNTAALIKYNLFKGKNRPLPPPINTVTCPLPLPQKA